MEYDNQHYQHACEEIQRHLEDCKASKMAHFDLSDYYYEKSRKSNRFHALSFAIITAWLLSTQFEGLIPNSSRIIKIMPIVLSVIVASLSALGPLLRYKELSIEHKVAGMKYHNLWRSCKNWKTDFPDDSTVKEAVRVAQKYREQLNDINRESPHLSSVDWNTLKRYREKKKLKDPTVYEFEQAKSV